jgi:hypothetical protein
MVSRWIAGAAGVLLGLEVLLHRLTDAIAAGK